jgi:hypothetical protein
MVDLYAGNLSDAVDRSNDVLQIDGNFARAAYHLATCYAIQGNIAEVRRLRDAFSGSPYAREFAAVEGFALANTGDDFGAQVCLGELGSEGDAGALHVLRAQIFAGLGKEEEAMRELRSAFAEREPLAVYMCVHPFFKRLWRRSDFQDVADCFLRGGYRLEDAYSLRLAGRSS